MKTKELEKYLSPKRLALLRTKLEKRMDRLTLVLDNVCDSHNTSAVLRTSEAFGIQNINVIEAVEKFKINWNVTNHAEKWLNLQTWPDYDSCYKELRQKGYKIYATCMADDAQSIYDLDLDHPIALVFGNEHRGVSSEMLAKCDGKVIIPMAGFTESLNISVAAAVAAKIVIHQIEKKYGSDAYIKSPIKEEIYRKWLQQHVKNYDRIKLGEKFDKNHQK